MDRRNAGADHFAHGARDHQLRSEAGVRVHQQGKRDGTGDPAGIFQDVVQRGNAKIRQTEGDVRDAGTREVQRAEPGAFRHESDQRVGRAGDLQRRFLGGRAAETITGAGTVHGRDGMPTFVSTSAA